MAHPVLAFGINGTRSEEPPLRLTTAVLIFAFTSLATPTLAQETAEAGKNHTIAPGVAMVPESSRVNAEDPGRRAHTNVRLTLAISPNPAEAPPFAGYGYETPASLACIYRVVSPKRGCNPNTTTNIPNGGSQSIAIVDAFDDPDAEADLKTFAGLFGLPFSADKFKVVYASGKQPLTDPSGGWELEESVDIEYAYSMAPNAMIYLVEANSNSLSDLFSAVLVATNLVRCGKIDGCPVTASGKGEISMSWGTPEFSNESDFDRIFTGKNVVYLAATGDSSGVIYPSASQNVIGVGGTSTARSLRTGNLIREMAWSDTGGGLSSYEPTPSYQSVIADIAQGARALPDISADANLATGVWVYDSFPNGISNPSHWWIVGGTSVSTPIVAGIINAASTASNHFAASTEDELTKMYSEYASGSDTYSSAFWDINYGACNFYMGSFSVLGYDLCTGLGSPKGLTGK